MVQIFSEQRTRYLEADLTPRCQNTSSRCTYKSDLIKQSRSNWHFLKSQLDQLLEIVHVADLRRNSYPLVIIRPRDTIIRQWIKCSFEFVAVEQIAAYHCPCSPLSCLAVHHPHILWILSEELVQTFTKGHELDKCRRHVVFKSELSRHPGEESVRVFILGTKIIDLVLIAMARLKKLLHIFVVVAVDALNRSGWETHRDYILRDVAKIQIEAILLIASLFLRYPLLKQVLRFSLFLDPLVRVQFFHHLFHLPLVRLTYELSPSWMRSYSKKSICFWLLLHWYRIFQYVMECVERIIVILVIFLLFLWLFSLLLSSLLLLFSVSDVTIHFFVRLLRVLLKRLLFKIKHNF